MRAGVVYGDLGHDLSGVAIAVRGRVSRLDAASTTLYETICRSPRRLSRTAQWTHVSDVVPAFAACQLVRRRAGRYNTSAVLAGVGPAVIELVGPADLVPIYDISGKKRISMQRRIWLDQHHIQVAWSRFGFSLLLTGLASSDRSTINGISLVVKQGAVQLRPEFASFRNGLLKPRLATEALGRFAANLDKGIAISATFLPDQRLLPGLASLEATVSWTDGLQERSRLASISLQPIKPLEFALPIGPDTIGIALATYNPDVSLFRTQIESIKSQSYSNWVCAIPDDGSAPALLAEMRAILGTDPRLALSAAPTNAGVYRNFERAISLLPESCGWIACAGQDDEWLPGKLEVLLREAKRTQSPLIFSDMAVYSNSGQKLSNTFWIYCRPETENPTAIAVANTVTGMAMLFRASVLSIAMPFPALPGMAYHDRWLTLAALAQGQLEYVHKALARYSQHGGSHTGVFKRSPGVVALTLQFAKCFFVLVFAALRPSLRRTLPSQLEWCAHWTSVELLSLSLQIEALPQRLPREQWRRDVWEQFQTLLAHPRSAIFRLSFKSLSDPYRRHMLTGYGLGRLFHSVISLALRVRLVVTKMPSLPNS